MVDEEFDSHGFCLEFLDLLTLINEKCIKNPPKEKIQDGSYASQGAFSAHSIRELKNSLPSVLKSDFTNHRWRSKISSSQETAFWKINQFEIEYEDS